MSLANKFLFFEVEIQFENNKRCENVEPALRDPRTVGRVENFLVFHAFHGPSFAWRLFRCRPIFSSLEFALGFTFQVDAVSVMHQPVEDSIGECRVF